MTTNTGFEENEISKNAHGGTEITKRSLAKNIPEDLQKEFQIIPSRVRELNPDKIRVYWCHDLPEDPECRVLADFNSRNRFHGLSFVSNWQLNDFVTKLRLPMSNAISVIGNPIDPIEFIEKPKDKINLIYFSTPQRGLEILVPVFEELAKRYDNIHLNVFSSFKIYGWEEADKNFEPLFERIRQHPQMSYHGFSDQSIIKEHLQKSHILAYPSIWKETSCRVLMESMSAGLVCVHPNLAALPETSGGLTTMYQFSEDHAEHANTFAHYLDHAINLVQNEYILGKNVDSFNNYLNFTKRYIDNRFNISNIAGQWEYMMKELLEKYPNSDSRKIPGEMFVYNT